MQITRSYMESIATQIAGLLFLGSSITSSLAEPPRVGEQARNFTVMTLDRKPVELKGLVSQGRVVLIVLRGWPGYQCPLCTRQVNDLLKHRSEIVKQGAQLLFIYPGPSEDLQAHAREFIEDKRWPEQFLFALDPDYTFTKAYGVRWEAPSETAYPSTFILDKGGKVVYAHISREHGDRISAETLLEALKLH